MVERGRTHGDGCKEVPLAGVLVHCGKNGGILRFNADCTARGQFETPWSPFQKEKNDHESCWQRLGDIIRIGSLRVERCRRLIMPKEITGFWADGRQGGQMKQSGEQHSGFFGF